LPIDLATFRLRSPLPVRLAAALALFLLALLLRVLVLPGSTAFPFVTFNPVTLAALYLCGLRPGGVVALLSAVAGYWFATRSPGTLRYDQAALVASLVFLAGTGLMVFLVSQVHRLLDRNASQLESRRGHRGPLPAARRELSGHGLRLLERARRPLLLAEGA